jgi:hypothetical protein
VARRAFPATSIIIPQLSPLVNCKFAFFEKSARFIIDLCKGQRPSPSQFFYAGDLVMKKMTIRKMLENIVAKTHGLDVKKFFLVSTDGEVATADFAIDLIWKLAEESSLNLLWEVEVVSAKRVGDYVTVIFNPDVEQTNGDPDKNLW